MIEKMIGGIIGKIIEDESFNEVRVGRISPELQNEFKKNKIAHKALHQEIKSKINEYIDKVTAEYEHKLDKSNEERMDIWEKAYEEIGLTQEQRGKRYRMKGDSRVMVRLDDKEEVASKSTESTLQ